MEDVLDDTGKVIGFKLTKKESSNFASWITNKIRDDKPVQTVEKTSSKQQFPKEVADQ